MTKVRSLEIPILFHNYKLLQDKEFILKGSNVYFVQGPNEVGKTSFLTALEGVMTAKDITDKKVTRTSDETDGFYQFTIPAADGSMVTIRNEFTDDKNKFIAIKEDGEKVSKVNEIRALFNYTPINVSEFFAMSRSAEGRRKQREIILKLLPDDLREKFNDADLKEGHYFKQRTEAGRLLDQSKGYVASVIIPESDIKLLEREKEAEDLLDKYQGYLDNRTSKSFIKDQIKSLKNEELRIQERIVQIEESLVKLNKDLGEDEPESISKLDDETLELKVNDGKGVIKRISEIKARQLLKSESQQQVDQHTATYDELTEDIEKNRTIKTDIVAKAELPVENISFDNDYLVIDGFRFDETQVCESDAVLLLANILAKINPGPIQVIGDASILDAKKLEQLNKIAEENNKVMFVDEVVRMADEMVVVGYEQTTTAPKKKPSKTPEIDKLDIKVSKKKEPAKKNVKPEKSDDAPLF